jgi:type II secretory pathway component PulF
MLLQNFGRTFALAAKIEDEEQLRAAIKRIKEGREKLPTILRKAMKQVTAVLPRRGGPGRQPKLKPNEASQMCDQIAMFIRQNNNLKQALQKVSQLTPQLLGKKVSPRTLQKAWNKRGQ